VGYQRRGPPRKKTRESTPAHQLRFNEDAATSISSTKWDLSELLEIFVSSDRVGTQSSKILFVVRPSNLLEALQIQDTAPVRTIRYCQQ